MLLTALIMRRGTSTVFLSLALGLGGLSWAGFGVNKLSLSTKKIKKKQKCEEKHSYFSSLVVLEITIMVKVNMDSEDKNHAKSQNLQKNSRQ